MYEHRDDIQPSPPDTDAVHRRMRWGLLAAVAVVLVAAIPGIALDSGGDTKQVTSAAFLPVTTTTVGTGVVAGVQMPPAPAPTTTTSTTRPPATTTTTARPAPAPAKTCHNSYDPACGPFRWDPDPGANQPLQVTASAQQVKAGDPVNFHIVADDPDAKIDRCYTFDFGDGQKGSTCPPAADCQTPYGPWTPPAKVTDHWVVDVPHKYPAPGSYAASFTLQSHSFCNPDPYGGSGEAPATAKAS